MIQEVDFKGSCVGIERIWHKFYDRRTYGRDMVRIEYCRETEQRPSSEDRYCEYTRTEIMTLYSVLNHVVSCYKMHLLLFRDMLMRRAYTA